MPQPQRHADRAAGNVPRFCPLCDRAGPDAVQLCATCGESLRDQGYCSVCEAFWTRAVGEPCPKHDLPLEPAPEPGARSEAADEAGVGWVTLARFGNPIEAEARRLRLEAEGIPTFLDGVRMGTNTLYQGALGGIKLQVPQGLVADARVLLDQSWAPVDDLDDAWEDLAPEPGASIQEVALGIALVPLAILAGLVLLLIAGLTWRGST